VVVFCLPHAAPFAWPSTGDRRGRSEGTQDTRPAAVPARGHEPANLADILERVLDKGIVIAGDIQVNLLTSNC